MKVTPRDWLLGPGGWGYWEGAEESVEPYSQGIVQRTGHLWTTASRSVQRVYDLVSCPELHPGCPMCSPGYPVQLLQTYCHPW
jgi:hypothetical protein